MTSLPPPTYYFDGITFNSAFYNNTSSSSSTGLTIAEGNALYLMKTVPDTASSIESFSSGILTNSLDYSGALTIGGTNATSIQVGNATTTQTSIYNPLSIGVLNAGNGISVDTITPYSGGNMTLGSNVSYNANFLGGINAVGNITTSRIAANTYDANGAASMLIGNTNATAISLGKATITTNVLGNFSVSGNTQMTGNLNVSGITTDINGLKTSLLDTSSAGALTIGNSTATSISLGKALVNTTIVGNLISANTDYAGAMTIGNTSATSLNIGNTMAAGNITIGGGQTTGYLNLGVSSARTNGGINIGTGSTAGYNIAIGGTGTYTSFYGPTTAQSTLTSTGVLTASAGITSSSLDYTGAMSIGGTNATGITIGKTGLLTTQAGNETISGNLIVSGAGGITSTIVDSSGALSLGATNATGITIGKTGVLTTIAGNQSVSGNLAITGITTMTGNTIMNGNATIAGTLGTTGITTDGVLTCSGLITANAGLTVSGTGTSNLLKFGASGNSGVFIQYGSISQTISVSAGSGVNGSTITFSSTGVAFSSTPAVFLSTSVGSTGGGNGRFITMVNNVSSTTFTPQYWNPQGAASISSITFTLYWMAIGN